VQTVN